MSMKKLFAVLVVPLLLMPSIVSAASLIPIYNLPAYTINTDSLMIPVNNNSSNTEINYPTSPIGPIDETNPDQGYSGGPIGSIDDYDSNDFALMYPGEIIEVNFPKTGSPIGPDNSKTEGDYSGGPVGPDDSKTEGNYSGGPVGPDDSKTEGNYSGGPVGPDNNRDESYNFIYPGDILGVTIPETENPVGPDNDRTISEHVDNYRIMFSPKPKTINGQDLPVYYFDDYRDNMRLDITEENRSSTATNRIEHVTITVYDESNTRKQVFRLGRNDINSNGLYIFHVNLRELNHDKNHYVTAEITYSELNDSSDTYIKTYNILKIIPKEDTSTPDTPNTPSTSQKHNLSYNIGRGKTEVDGQSVYLYNENESVNISAWQTTYSSESPIVTDIQFYINNNMIKNCSNINSCNLNYKLTEKKKANIIIRTNYKNYNKNTNSYDSYTYNYDLGFFLMKSNNSTNNNTNDTTNNNSNNTADTTSTNNDTLLAMNQYLLLKGSSASVYLVNQYNHRFYIPDWSVLKSWYYQPNIIQVNDAQLGQYSLLENVIYRPGSLIKIATDPKCYTVGLNGELHWVYNEDVARALYGARWNKNIYIVPDSLFPSYSFADDIYNANDYDMPSFSEAANMYNY